MANKILWYVVDDGDFYNVLCSKDFDRDGRYITNPLYTFDDFDIAYTYTREESAWSKAASLNE